MAVQPADRVTAASVHVGRGRGSALPGSAAPDSASRDSVARAQTARGKVPLWSGSTDRWSLAAQLSGLLVLVLLVVGVPVLVQSARSAEASARAEAIARSRATAYALAGTPWVAEAALSADPPAVLAGPIEQVRAANDLLFVIVMSPEGVRWTHPDPTHIGGAYIGGLAAAQAGGEVVEEFTGSLGPSIRVVVPARRDGRIVALISTAVSIEGVQRVVGQRMLQVGLLTVLSLGLGAAGIALIVRHLRRQTRGVGPIELARLHSYHEALLHSVRSGLILIGNDGSVVLCNDEARTLVATPEVRPGEVVSDLWLDADLAELLTSGRSCDGEVFVEDGRALVVTQQPAVFEGETLGRVVTLRDRTDLIRLTGELDSLRSFSEMLRSRAHEADNRLHTVIMLVELGRGDEAIRFATDTIAQSQALVDTVTGAVRDAPLAALLLGKSAQAEERGVTLELTDGIAIPDVGAASVDLVVVLGNLIDNAVDAAASGPEPRWVEVDGYLDAGGRLVLEVLDSGPGIPPELVERAFQRGWSTKNPHEAGRPHGRGIGLSLVAGAIRRLAGGLEVGTSPSRFVVRVPLPRNDAIGDVGNAVQEGRRT